MLPKDYRHHAAEQVNPYNTTLALTELVVGIALGVLGCFNLIPFAGVALSSAILLIIAGPLQFSYVDISKKVYAKETPKIEDIFLGFNRFAQAFVLEILVSIFVFLWSLLLIVPGIIKAYSYSQALYLAHNAPEKASADCIKESMKIMKGHKGDLFLLDLSYIGWYLLSILTLGILLLWVVPKHRQARYLFHLNLMNSFTENK